MNVNAATDSPLSVSLGLSRVESPRVVVAGPSPMCESLTRVLAARLACREPSLISPQPGLCVEDGAGPLADPGTGKGMSEARNANELAAGTPGSITGKWNPLGVPPPVAVGVAGDPNSRKSACTT